ncbi:MAG TPA: TatD family hydrolase [Methanomassiliicoccales archaeon]|nr:TatD family hydrolase [Methanomassiliicoccales archaeon]
MRLPILDDHVHLQPQGRNVEAVKEFERAGGTHLILSHLPYDEVTISSEADWERSYEITLRLAEKCRDETSVAVDVTLGPYPVLLLDLEKRFGLARGIEIMKAGMESAQRAVLERKAVAIGEVGRPHFPVPGEIMTASNEILLHGMRLAKEAGCAIVLHTESATPENMREFALMADSVGLDRGKVVKHYSPPLVLPEENHGLCPSVLASRPNVNEALRKGTRFMMETDFLDDLARPGAVMAITTVPKRTKGLLESKAMSEEQARIIHQENPKKVYGIKTREPS